MFRLRCGHVHCVSCLRANFDIAMRTVPFRPVQCCQRIETVLLRRVVLLSTLLIGYRQKVSEFDTPEKLYCWDSKCSAFIPPALREGTGTSAKCRRCL